MAITLRQKNGSAQTGTLTAAPPAWGSATVAGNLLIMVGAEAAATAGTWPTLPAGWNVFAPTPAVFASAAGNPYGIFWKIAAGTDATPGAYGESSSTQNWVTYTYEFVNPLGWIASAADVGACPAAGVAAVTKASGSTATLAQAQELAIALMAGNAAVTALTFTNGYTVDLPGTSNGKMWFGWKETVSTAAESTTANWTTSTPCGCRVATFKTSAAAAPAGRSEITVVRRVWSGR